MPSKRYLPILLLNMISLFFSLSVKAEEDSTGSFEGNRIYFYLQSMFYITARERDVTIGVNGDFISLPADRGVRSLMDWLVVWQLNYFLQNQGLVGIILRSMNHLIHSRSPFEPLCEPLRVAIRQPTLNRLIALHSQCINNNQPAWHISTAPVSLLALTEYEIETVRYDPLFQLWLTMKDFEIADIYLQPGQARIMDNHQLRVHACDTQLVCQTLDLNIKTGTGSETTHWLIEHLDEQPNPFKATHSLLDRHVLRLIHTALEDLYHSLSGKPESQAIRLPRGAVLQKQGTRHWHYQPNLIESLYTPRDWLYQGQHTGILPLEPCFKTEGSQHNTCPGYLLWAQGNSRASGRSSGTLTLAYDQYDAHGYYLRHDIPGIAELINAPNQAVQFLDFLIRLPAQTGNILPALVSSLAFLQQRNIPDMTLVKSTGQSPALSASFPEKALLPARLQVAPFLPVSMPRTSPDTTHAAPAAQPQENQHNRVATAQPLTGLRMTPRKQKSRDDDPQPPPGQPIAPFTMLTHPVYWEDMLLQLTNLNLVPSILPPTRSIAAAITEQFDMASASVVDLERLLTDIPEAFQANFHRRFQGQSVFTTAEHLTRHFNPVHDAQVYLLAQLLRQNVVVFMATTPGQHQVKVFDLETGTFARMDLTSVVPNHIHGALLLAYTPLSGVIRVKPLHSTELLNFQKKPFPVTREGFKRNLRLWLKDDERLRIDLDQSLTDLFAEKQNPVTCMLIQRAIRYHGLHGTASMKVDELTGARQVRISKTLLEMIGWCWLDNVQHFRHCRKNFEDEIRSSQYLSTNARHDYRQGEIDTLLFPRFYINLALLALQEVPRVQKRLLNTIGDAMHGYHEGLAIYGSLALRTHLVHHVFNGNLLQAFQAGISGYNDVDIMAVSEQLATAFIQTLEPLIKQREPLLQPQVDTHNSKVGSTLITTHKMKILWHGHQVLIIDISYSNSPGYFDFTDTAIFNVPHPGKQREALKMPMVGLKTVIRHLRKERLLKHGDDAERRRNKAIQSLALLARGDEITRQLLNPQPETDERIAAEPSLAVTDTRPEKMDIVLLPTLPPTLPVPALPEPEPGHKPTPETAQSEPVSTTTIKPTSRTPAIASSITPSTTQPRPSTRTRVSPAKKHLTKL